MMKGKVLIFLFAVFHANCENIGIFRMEYCNSSEQYLVINCCELKNNLVNLSITLPKPLNKIFVSLLSSTVVEEFSIFTQIFQFEMELKMSINNVYRTFFKLLKTNWCDMIKRSRKSGPLAKITSSSVGKFGNDFQKGCPWVGEKKIVNFSIDRKHVSIFPNGLYKLYLTLSNEDSIIIFWQAFQIKLV
jgi:hypothetical protein